MATQQATRTETPQAETQPETQEKWQDCTSCRLTGAATLTGLGLYALHEARQQGAFAKVRPKGSPRGAPISAAIGVVFIGLGIGRLFV
ncbi:hypothetical protein CspeluHIS016_0210630 [Cutaneotrichosporon spelunceum]|uniref:Distal membrane-arm assembly complex protein 1-like domain-containing protein n=1 Tax=Cutaneotrichosporon spelunceum TaxID=1672016 RepID=A0AAD3TT40_9TREE|nr:hypothetical protein CspeluHIS016_0210630 [Cutaneotrichosporon spelunceum]